MNLSNLHFYSIGRVAANKPLDSKIIQVWGTEVASALDGEVTDTLKTSTITGEDASGNKFTSRTDTSAALPATWLPFGQSNRITAPDVRRGEHVMLWQFGDAEKLYWTDMDDGILLRRLETVIFAISGSPKEDTVPTSENTYSLEMSTHKKHVTLHTSNANGEPFTYDIQINTGEGNVVIRDNVGNYISMNSAEREIELVNQDGSCIDINKRMITIEAPDLIQMKAKKIVANAMQFIVRAPSFSVSTPNFTAADFSKPSIQSMTFSGSLATAIPFTASKSTTGIPPYPGNDDADWDDNQTYIKMDREHIWMKALELLDIKSPNIDTLSTDVTLKTQRETNEVQVLTTTSQAIVTTSSTNVTTAATFNLTAETTLSGDTQMNGDLGVSGHVKAGKVSSQQAIDAPNV